MQESGRIVAGALVLLLTILPAGFVLHASPRFPGSFAGSLTGIVGGVLMLVPLAYLVIKRVPLLRRGVTRYVSLRTLLSVHIYAGIAGPILGMLHSAHRFDSAIGISLTGMMIVVVLSGYIGRYLLNQIGTAIEGRRSELARLTAALAQTTPNVAAAPAGIIGRAATKLLPFAAIRLAGAERIRLAGAVADVEFAVRAEEVIRDLFGKWSKLHIVIATLLYGLLAVHVWAGLYFALRWL